ncbi:MAG: DUF4296 domain-containing protein [Flavobacteriaceae bacterium]
MKPVVVILLILLVACNPNVDKPDNLIGEDKMAELLYELSVINASRGFRPSDGKEVMDVNPSFYGYHGIDSLQFALSNAYYAAHPKLYLSIVERAEVLLKSQKDSLVGSEKTQKLDKGKVQLLSDKKPNK